LAKRRKSKKPVPERKAVRYAIYSAFLILVAIIGISTWYYSAGKIGQTYFIVVASIAQSFAFSMLAIAWMTFRGNNLKQITGGLGLWKKITWKKAIALGISAFALIFLLEIGLSLFESATGIQLPTNVQQIFSGLPLYFIVFSTIIAPINEEILFRGFLVPRIGIIASAIIFGLLHYLSYASISEFIAAFAFGIIAGYIRKRYSSLYPSILAHMLVNALGFLLIFAI
jgi:membrane protease YdiL (CAAX protease family)